MSVQLLRTTVARIALDPLARWTISGVFCVSAIVYFILGPVASTLIPLFYMSGLSVATFLLQNRAKITEWKVFQSIKVFLGGYQEAVQSRQPLECGACGAQQCQRHILDPDEGKLYLDEELDRAVGDFYSVILRNFISSWFSSLSNDEVFLYNVRECLRDATCRLGVRLQRMDLPLLITEKLLPVLFAHSEIVSKMMTNGVSMDQFGNQFVLQEHPLHPAVCNRQAELQYLRYVARKLIPKLISRQHCESRAFLSLVRELIACWVLLPLLDVIADPNLLNALIIAATDPPLKRIYREGAKVPFLDAFATEGGSAKAMEDTKDGELNNDTDDLLKDQTKLYAFMQFLKREGAVDLLRFHLDVDHLNSELLDPRVTTDPAKLSALQQQSEKLMQTYEVLVAKMPGDFKVTDELCVAHENIKGALAGKWKEAFQKTPEYFRLVYGDKTIPDRKPIKRSLEQTKSNSGTRLTKMSVGVDAAATSANTNAWDGFSETSSTTSNTSSQSNATIYSSVTHKLRKERGQYLDQFMATFMQSIEQATDVGEDVCLNMNQGRNKQDNSKGELPQPPGRNLVFGDLFELRSAPNGKEKLNYHLHRVRGPSQCLVYIVAEILRFPSIIVKFMISLVNISKQTVDRVICSLLQRLVNMGLYEPRLAVLIDLLKDQLFGGDKSREEGSPPTPTELLERQRLARTRLVALNRHLGSVADMLQSPSMNKHLIYSLFDIIIDQMYPDMLLASGESDEEDVEVLCA